MEIREESKLMFEFPEGSHVVKFDDTKYYRNLFNSLPDSKGVDFVLLEKDAISFIEVKNCLGDEGNFGSHTRTKKMIMSDLQRSINSKMRWMNCKVSVVDSSTYNEKIFQICQRDG